MRLCRANLRRFRREGQDFLSRIVTGDETWVYSWDPELKRQSAQWRNQGFPRPEKAQRKQGAMKVMHIVFFDAAGVLVNGLFLQAPQLTLHTTNGFYKKNFVQQSGKSGQGLWNVV